MRSFLRKTILITGAAGGLGSALCLRFGRENATIVALDIGVDRLEVLSERLTKAGVQHRCYVCDLTQAEACERTVRQITEELGPVDVLVNNAGITWINTAQRTPPDRLRRVMELNFFGQINVTLPALPSLRERRGQIIVISSVAGFAPLYGRTAYAASKHALHGWFETLRTELVDDGVSVLMVCPASVDTAIRQRSLGLPAEAGTLREHEAGGSDAPEAVADQIFEAARRDKRFLTTGKAGRIAAFLRRFWPRRYDKLMRKHMAPAVDAREN